MNIEKAFIRKRKAFEHEHEVRLLKTVDNQDNIPIDDTSFGGIKNRLVSHSIEFNNGENVKKYSEVSYKHIKNFIKSVMLHPLAPEWFDNTLKDYCKNSNINYKGKSKLYKLDLK